MLCFYNTSTNKSNKNYLRTRKCYDIITHAKIISKDIYTLINHIYIL
jgi:hypothetical protein